MCGPVETQEMIVNQELRKMGKKPKKKREVYKMRYVEDDVMVRQELEEHCKKCPYHKLLNSF